MGVEFVGFEEELFDEQGQRGGESAHALHNSFGCWGRFVAGPAG
ncbi:hypothetical protein [Luteococcus japonicus]|nr:hypothetical protein [Luteococcus japonicus]